MAKEICKSSRRYFVAGITVETDKQNQKIKKKRKNISTTLKIVIQKK